MASNNEKLACESCIRGHRVAKCQHTDRPLLRVSRKGRPVSQCDHCRTLRNSRSVHTKCKCASASHQAMLKEFGQERCLCDEGETCKCAHKTDRKNGKGIRSPVSTDKSSTPPTALSLSEFKDTTIETSQILPRSCCAPSLTPSNNTTETMDPISISNLGIPNLWSSSDVVDTLGPSVLQSLPESILQVQQNSTEIWDQAPDLGYGEAPMPIPTFDDPSSTMGQFEMGSLFNEIDISQINIPDEWVIRELTTIEPHDPKTQHNQL